MLYLVNSCAVYVLKSWLCLSNVLFSQAFDPVFFLFFVGGWKGKMVRLYRNFIQKLGGGNSNIFGIFTPIPGDDDPI